MENIQYISTEYYEKWKSKSLSDNVIVDELRQHGLDSLQIVEILSLFKKKKNDEKQTLGFVILGIGAFIGFLSCVFTMLDLIPELRGFMLYGLTSIALVFIMAGLYFVFE